MKRTHLILLIGCTLFLLVCSCNGKKEERSVREIAESITIVQPDTSVRATLETIGRDSLHFTPEHGDDAIALTYDAARSEGQIFGTLHEGDRYALLIDPSRQDILRIYNITQLSGQWFYNVEEGRGFTFTTAGALSSINPDDVCLKKWKFHNGHIIIYYVGLQDVVHNSREYKSDTTDILALSPDTLVFNLRGRTLRCTRQHGAIKFHM